MIYIRTLIILLYSLFIKKLNNYYSHINYLPLFNYSEILKGNYLYLFKRRTFLPIPKVLFEKVFYLMNFQFKYLDNSYLRNIATLTEYKSKYAITKNKRWLNEANTLENKLKKQKISKFDIDEFTDYIERTYNLAPASIDTKKITVSKAFSNFQNAKELNEAKEKQNGSN